MDDEGALGGGVWAFLEVEEVAQLPVDEVREALEERGLDVEGDEERVRQRLILAIQREDANLLLLDSTRSALEVGDGMEDAAFEEDYHNKWGRSDLADGARAFEPAAAAAGASAGSKPRRVALQCPPPAEGNPSQNRTCLHEIFMRATMSHDRASKSGCSDEPPHSKGHQPQVVNPYCHNLEIHL